MVRIFTAVAPAVSPTDTELAQFLWEHKCLANEHAQLEQLRAIGAVPNAAYMSSDAWSVGSPSDTDSKPSCPADLEVLVLILI